MLVDDFDYALPIELIAQVPVEPRDHSRLMIVDRATGQIRHEHFYNLLNYIADENQFVFNDTKVIPARLYGHKATGGEIEILLLNSKFQVPNSNTWEFIGKNIGGAKKLLFENEIIGEIYEQKIYFNKSPLGVGHVPLPPYIKNKFQAPNSNRYQTVYARQMGSVAAPTAGLHFTEELMQKIKNKTFVTLNVGLGTFQPLRNQIVESNHLHPEYYDVQDFKTNGNIVAVGTTSVRVLESFANTGQRKGETDIFIYPPYKFKIVDKLITNFHLPKSSLLMLVCAFGGQDLIMRAYEEAVKEKYRFFSFGDAMLVT